MAEDPTVPPDEFQTVVPTIPPKPPGTPPPVASPFSRDFLSRYEMVRFLGKGAMGAVFLMRQVALDRLVAVKVLASHLFSHADVERFQREARILGRFDDEHIVAVHDIGFDGTVPFMVCHYVDGETLADRIHRPPPLSLTKSIRMVTQILAGLRIAHKNGVIHRDVKPSNIFLSKDGKPKIGDFGLAKGLAQPSGTIAGSILGTPSYMSPEQCQGAIASERSDLYSVGIILYELTTGRVPFRGPQLVDYIRQHTTESPPSIRSLRPDLPASLDVILSKALSKDPILRYDRASTFRKDLKELEKSLDPKSQGSTPDERHVEPDSVASIDSVDSIKKPLVPQTFIPPPPSEARGNRSSYWLSVGALVVALLAFGGFWFSHPNAPVILPVSASFISAPPSSAPSTNALSSSAPPGSAPPSSAPPGSTAPPTPSVEEKVAILQGSGKIPEAIAELEAALKITPEKTGLRYTLGKLLAEDRTQLARAQVELEAVVAAEPKNAGAHATLASVLARRRERNRAEAEYKTALILDPSNDVAAYRYGDLLYLEGRYAEAETQLLTALKVNDKYVLAREILAWVYLKMPGRTTDAEAQLKILLDADPGLIRVRNRLSGLYVNARRWADLERLNTEAHRKYSNEPLPCVYLGEAYQAQGRKEDAERYFREGVAKGPQLVITHDRLGSFLEYDKKDLAGATDEYQKCVELLPPQDERGPRRLGKLLLRRGLYAEAIAPFKKIVDLGRASEFDNLDLAMAYEKTRQPQFVESTLLAALRSHNTVNLHRALANYYQMVGRLADARAQRDIVTQLEGSQPSTFFSRPRRRRLLSPPPPRQ